MVARVKKIKNGTSLYSYIIAALVLFVIIILLGTIFGADLLGGTVVGIVPLFIFLVIVGFVVRIIARLISKLMER